EAYLVRVGLDHVAGWAHEYFARVAIDDHGIAGIDALDRAAHVRHRDDAERACDDRDVALPAAFLDDEAPEPRAVVVEKIRGTHGARDHDRVVWELLVGGASTAGIGCRQNAQEPVRKVLEVAHAIAPI